MQVLRISRRVAELTLVLFLLSSLLLPLGSIAYAAPAAPQEADWVGNLAPANGSVASGAPYTITVELYEPGYSDTTTGDTYNFECSLHWGKVGAFGGAWTEMPPQPMTYSADVGSNDQYAVTISPLSGLYEYTASCIDLSDGLTTWSSSPNGRLTVGQPTSGACLGATPNNNDIFWSPLLHDSFSTDYRAPGGAVTNAQATVNLGVRTCRNDVTAAQLRVWNDRTNAETLVDLAPTKEMLDPVLGEVSFWSVDLPIPADPTILYYTFRLIDGTKTVYYRDDDTKFYGGGLGTPENDQGTAEMNSYQLTVYDQTFTVPAWAQRGIAYQILPDRFRDGNSANNPATGRFYYNAAGGTIVRSGTTAWNTQICDPRLAGPCQNKYGENFYGGDLQGVSQMVTQNYLSNLGVTVAYLNPIFSSPSNHKYDTANYKEVDKDFGAKTAWQNLIAAGATKSVGLILDGVFNHTSSDSAYFDRYSRYNFADKLVRQDYQPFADDNIQACESPSSARRPWYFLPAVGTPSASTFDRCDPDDTDDVGGPWNVTYETWYGYGSLPKLDTANTAVRNLLYTNGVQSVGPYWVEQGANGWRLDVGGDIDPGLTNDPANTFWEGFRTAIRDTAVQTRTVPLILGEEWGDASPWLLGNEWDSAMNYRFRSAALGWLFTGCTGNGCTDGTKFEDNDSNDASSSGAITQLSPSELNARLRSIAEDYPAAAFKAMMNLGGSHDTNRLRFLLKKINNDDDAVALQRMREFYLLSFSYPGLPTIYYGDEVGLTGEAAWANGKWEDDPYNRAPFPWPDAPGYYTADTDLQTYLRRLTSARQGYRALQDGDVDHGIVLDDANKLYGYARWTDPYRYALVVLNRDGVEHSVTIDNLDGTRYDQWDGKELRDVLTGQLVTMTPCASVNGATTCTLTFTVPANGGVLLVDPALADLPDSTIARISLDTAAPQDAQLNWNTIRTDGGNEYEFPNVYEVWWSENPYFYVGSEDSAKVTDQTLPPFGMDGSRLSYTDLGAVGDPLMNHYYKVTPTNSAGGRAMDSNTVGEFDFALTPGAGQ